MHLRNKSHLCGSGKFVAENPGIQSPNIPLGLFSSLIFNQSPSPMKIKSLGSRSRSKSVNKLSMIYIYIYIYSPGTLK